MRKFGLLGLLAGIVALALPAGASATHGTTCNYAKTQAFPVKVVDDGTNQVYVYEGSGTSGQADAAVGACIFVAPNATGFQGGTGEAGVTTTKGELGNQAWCVPTTTVCVPENKVKGPGGYVVLDGDDANTQQSSKGYIGLSNMETGAARDPDCNGDDGNGTPGSTNSGGCVGVKGTPVDAPVPLVMCGFTSGPTWDATPRDGCFVP